MAHVEDRHVEAFDLDERLRNKIKLIFVVDDEKDPVELSLL